MSPIDDPRFSKARWDKTLQQDREAGERASRMEYTKPLVMLGLGVPLAVGLLMGSMPDDAAIGFLGAAIGYVIVLVATVAIGTAGMFIAAKLFLGGAGPLGLGVLRIAGACAVYDVVYFLVARSVSLCLFPFIVATLVFALVLMWLFEMESSETALTTTIIVILKVLAWGMLFYWLAGMFG